jgi:glycyl-tRNA synthetase beta chain
VAQNPDRLDDIVQRLEAVQAFASLPEAGSLAAANKRITNILKKNEEALAQATTVNPALLHDEAEKKLAAAVTRVQPEVDAAFAAGDFTGTLMTLAQLRDDVDAFFNDVMVMADDIALRNNRLALLSSLHGMMNRVADISKLAT